MGVQDSVPKTPEWAEQITGVKAREIVALATDWAANPTCLLGQNSGACRKAYDYEYARMMATLQVMQGLGKPGVNLYSGRKGQPYDYTQPGFNGYSDGGMNVVANHTFTNPVPQVITENYVYSGFFNPPVSWTGGSGISGSAASPSALFRLPLLRIHFRCRVTHQFI